MQKKSQKLQSMQDKKRKYLKDACACEEEMGGAEGTFRPKSRATVGRQQQTWKLRSRPCKLGIKEEQLRVALQWMLL